MAIGQTIAADPERKLAVNYWDNKPTSNVCVDVDSERLLSFIKTAFSQ